MDRAGLAVLEGSILAFLAERCETMGADAGGLQAYYAQRLEKRRAFSRYDRELIDQLADVPVVVHAGIGIGQLGLALALRGTRVIGYESDPRRHAAAIGLRDALAPAAPFEIREARFPDGLAPPPGALLLFTNVVAGWPEALYGEILAAMRGFGRTILDLRRFGEERREAQEQAVLAARIRQAGFVLHPLPLRAENCVYVEVTPAPQQ